VLHADPGRFGRVLLNLLDNARDFTPAGGHVVLRGPREHGQRPDSLPLAVISATDDGPCVGEDEAARVFDRSYRGHGSERTEGAGLGLAIAKRLVQSHHGSIEALRPATGGMAVVIRMPLAPTACST
jgi:signal transduction histidine kinase